MYIYIIDYGDIYESRTLYKKAYISKTVAEKKRKMIEEKLHKEHAGFERIYTATIQKLKVDESLVDLK